MQVCPDQGQLLRLRDLFPEGQWFGLDDIGIRGCTCDSRKVRNGDLFVAIAGSRFDGLNFVDEAIERGCAAVLSDRPLPQGGLSAPYGVVANARAAYGRICHALAGNPSQTLKLIGVTGTNGKTTTSCLIAGILTAAGYRTGVLGTLGYLDGARVEKPAHSALPPDQFASLLARMVRNGCTHAVMEVSSRALEKSRVAGACFDAACVTNVTRDHLDRYGSRHDYWMAKSKLFNHLRGEGFVVLNADDPGAAAYLHQLDGPVLTVGIHSPAEITAVPIEMSLSEQTFLLTAGCDTAPVRTQMIGIHHIYNCLSAAAVGLAYGIPLTTVARGLESVGHVPGRLERIECGQPFGVFVDDAHTPETLAGALNCLRNAGSRRVLCVVKVRGDGNREKRLALAQIAEKNADVAILTHDPLRYEGPDAICDDSLHDFKPSSSVRLIADRTEAIHDALLMARPGDCVLIAGGDRPKSGSRPGDRNVALDDREVARDWLQTVKPFAP
jgi:UDP-N-acetylmuramoyl-L-alanyl-D-glutamate--2,6-diaminopimelate ligase